MEVLILTLETRVYMALTMAALKMTAFRVFLGSPSGELLLLGTLSFGGASTMACLMKTNSEGKLEQMP